MEHGGNEARGRHGRFDVPDPGAPDELERLRTLVGHFERMLASLPAIEQAKGILMATEGCTEEQAFDMLRAASQRLNTPLREVARRLVASQDQRALLHRSHQIRSDSIRLLKEAAELRTPRTSPT